MKIQDQAMFKNNPPSALTPGISAPHAYDYPMKKGQNKGEGNMGKIQPSIILFNVDAAGPRRVRASNASRAATKSKPSLARLLENQSGCLCFRSEQMLFYKPAITSPSPRTGSKN